jgi:tripartite-type tricarboxylate transporter receptor subunit TctC
MYTRFMRMAWNPARAAGAMRWLLSVVAYALCAQAQAQAYPSRPIVMVVPLAAGSSLDVVARMIVQKMSDNMGQQIVVDNQPGAAGMIGLERFSRAAPDGYTLGAFNDAPLTMLPNLRKKVPYDPLTSFAPVGLMVNNSWILVSHPSLPVTTIAELVALARARPGVLNYSSGGSGSPQHVAMELFESMAGIKLMHVPYKGTTQATTDVIGGQMPMMFSGTNAVVSFVREGKLRGLAVGGTTRSPLLPAVPTMAEAGVPAFEASTYTGIVLQAAAPKEVVTKVYAALLKALALPATRESFARLGAEVISSTPEEFTARLTRDIAQWKRVQEKTKIELE